MPSEGKQFPTADAMFPFSDSPSASLPPELFMKGLNGGHLAHKFNKLNIGTIPAL
jgi:hypothetical protein